MTANRGRGVPAASRRTGRRRPMWAALMAVAATLLVSATPGVAAATTTGTVTPLLDCYKQNSDGSWSVVLGYTSTYNGSVNIPLGTNNNTNPSSYGPQMPTKFASGTHHAAVAVKVAYADMTAYTYWYLDGHRLDYLQAAYASGVCSASTPLPANGNGTGIAVALLGAGVVGAVVLRRFTRRTAAEARSGDEQDAVPAGTGSRTDA